MTPEFDEEVVFEAAEPLLEASGMLLNFPACRTMS
uniref:Vezatin, adherens junctions transmembrane protein n=1 Tax=Homo sapiens TaxID=9606 RepID=F8VRY3_HUMAN